MPAPATRDYQRAQVALRALTYKDLPRLWRLLDLDRLDATFTVFAAAVLQLVRQRRAVSVSLGRRYLTALRAGVDEPAPDVEPSELPTGPFLAALRSASVISVKMAMSRGETLDLASRNALVRSMGLADKFINDGARELIRASVEADPAARGWIRVTLGTCDFCASQAAGDHMHAGTANFPRHDHCGCVPEPQYEKAPVTSSEFTPEQLRDALDPTRKRTAAAIKKELAATKAGKDLAAQIESFTGTRGGVANLRKNIEKVLDGTASPAVEAKTRAFLDAMNLYPTEDVPTLFRGFAVRVEEDTNAWWDAFEGQFEPGQRFTLNASSFSSSEKKAAEFSRMIGGTRRASSNYTAVRMELEGGQALPVETLSKFKSEKEWITGGEFEVVRYERATPKNPYYKVVIRQIKKLEATP